MLASDALGWVDMVVEVFVLIGCVIVMTMSHAALLFFDLLAGGPCCTVVEVTWCTHLLLGTTMDLSFLGGIILYLGGVLAADIG